MLSFCEESLSRGTQRHLALLQFPEQASVTYICGWFSWRRRMPVKKPRSRELGRLAGIEAYAGGRRCLDGVYRMWHEDREDMLLGLPATRWEGWGENQHLWRVPCGVCEPRLTCLIHGCPSELGCIRMRSFAEDIPVHFRHVVIRDSIRCCTNKSPVFATSIPDPYP